MPLSPTSESKRKAVCGEFRSLMESRPGLSQADVARMLNTTRSTVHKYVNGLATPRPIVMEMLRSKLARAARHESGEILFEDRNSPMSKAEREIIQALRRIEPMARRQRMAAAVREVLLSAAPPLEYRLGHDIASPLLSEEELAAVAEEHEAADAIARNEQASSGVGHDLATDPPTVGGTTGPRDRRVDSRKENYQ